MSNSSTFFKPVSVKPKVSQTKQLTRLLEALTPDGVLYPHKHGIELGERAVRKVMNAVRNATLRDLRATKDTDGELAVCWVVPIGCAITFIGEPKPKPQQTPVPEVTTPVPEAPKYAPNGKTCLFRYTNETLQLTDYVIKGDGTDPICTSTKFRPNKKGAEMLQRTTCGVYLDEHGDSLYALKGCRYTEADANDVTDEFEPPATKKKSKFYDAHEVHEVDEDLKAIMGDWD